jgi:hypothetical protein
MTVMADDKLFQYYERQGILPTFADFKSHEQLKAYDVQRRELFRDKLMMPPVLFRGAEVLEFGPDSGENAVVFAGWGATMTLAEPNRQAHAKIRAYFERFGLLPRLRELVLSDVEGFRSDRRFDIIDAEGFIYTIQPSEIWLRVFQRWLNPDGCGVISFYERNGAFFELTLKAIHAAGKALTGRPAVEAAKLLFEPKWDSIPHARAFESWVMDVLENPFVRNRTFIYAGDLCGAANALGFDIHASWPSYRDTLDIYWHKKINADDDKLRRSSKHLQRSRLSFFGGRKLYLVGQDETVESIGAAIERLMCDVDAMIDDPLGETLARVISGLVTLRGLVAEAEIFADDRADVEAVITTLDSFLAIFSAIARRDIVSLASLTQSDPDFINIWGQPNHFLVLRKRSELAPEGR